jgi:hypothetical protein
MGFACQGFPRFKYVRLWRPDLANLSFVGMALGLAFRMAAGWPWAGATPLGLAGGVLEAASVVLFATVMTRTLAQAPQRDEWDRYVWFSLACFTVVALLEPLAFWLTRPGVDPALLIPRISGFMAPYRNVQLLGFAGVLILGVGQRILPTAFGFREVGKRLGRSAFLLLSFGLGLDIVGWILFRATRSPGWALASWLGTSAYAVGALLIAVGLRGFTRGGADDRSAKFIRAAFWWMALACVMVFAEPFYARALGLRFSHAYHGAIRHAFTVGFISLMILGVSSKVVPILQGIDVRGLPGLWWPFLLINAGNSLRVFSQVATDLVPGPAYPLMGISGAFEVAGLAIWGVHLWRLLAARAVPDATRGPITAESRVASIAEEFPQTLDVFEEFGFKELRNPILRNTLARKVTVRMACGLKHVDEEKFLAALRERALGARA